MLSCNSVAREVGARAGLPHAKRAWCNIVCSRTESCKQAGLSDQQVSALSSPFAHEPYAGQPDPAEGLGQDLTQPLLRSPSQLSSAAAGASDVRLNAIPENEETHDEADTTLGASQESKEQVKSTSQMAVYKSIPIPSMPSWLGR